MGPVSPDNVQETGVSPDERSRSPIVAGERSRSSELEERTWSRPRSDVFVPYSLPALIFEQ
jgi:hypothetical protein